MAIDVLEVSGPGLAYIVLGGFVVAFSMLSLIIKEKLYVNEVVLGTGFGILMGPHCANIFDPRSWSSKEREITLEVMRVVLATGLFAIGVELPRSYLARHAKGLLVMVVPTMAFGWVVVAGILKALMPNLSYVSCLAISACLTPTDPIISAAIIGGKFALKHVPTNLRRILAAESAANDGLAYPFLTIAIYLTVEPTTRSAIGKWFLIGWLYQVILGTVIGAVIGIGFSKFMKFALGRGFIDRESYVAQYLALAVLTIGICSVLGSDDLLGAFAAGSAISWDGHFNIQIENEVFSSVIDLVLNCGAFIYIGAWLPFDSYHVPELGIEPWKLVVLFIAILAVRRIPSLLLLYKWIPEISSWKEALFSGHFGPMGVGAIFVSTLALTKLSEPDGPPQSQEELLAATLQPIVSFVVLGSIIIHGLSIPFFTFGRGVHSRTMSLSQTFTSRQTNLAPDWLLYARRTMDTRPEVADPEAGANGVVVNDTEVSSQSGDPVTKSPRISTGDINASLASIHGNQESDAPVMSREAAAKEHLPHTRLGEEGMGLEDYDEEVRGRPAPPRLTTDVSHPITTDSPSGAQTPRTVRFPEESSGDLRRRAHARLEELPARLRAISPHRGERDGEQGEGKSVAPIRGPDVQ